jgi:hypothetical protein
VHRKQEWEIDGIWRHRKREKIVKRRGLYIDTLRAYARSEIEQEERNCDGMNEAGDRTHKEN